MLRTLCLASTLILLVSGCAIRTITYPEDMTKKRAVAIIQKYTESAFRRGPPGFLFHKKISLPPLKVTETHFPNIYLIPVEKGGRRIASWAIRPVKYSDLGEYRLRYSWANLMAPIFMLQTMGLLGPGLCRLQESGNRIPPNPESVYSFPNVLSYASRKLRGESRWLSITPLWLVGTSLWKETSTENYVGALLFMRDRQQHSPE